MDSKYRIQHTMAGKPPQRELLKLIRDYASENSHGERRVVGLKKKIEELRSELEVADEELEEAKRTTLILEQEFKGYEVEASVCDSYIMALEARRDRSKDMISSISTEVEHLKDEEATLRDEFINQMLHLNSRIRKYQESMEIHDRENEQQKPVEEHEYQFDRQNLEDMLANIVSKTAEEEQEYSRQQNIQKQLKQEYDNLQRKISLIRDVTKETASLQELAKQASELEQACCNLGEELKKRCVCPQCHKDNVEALGGSLQDYYVCVQNSVDMTS